MRKAPDTGTDLHGFVIPITEPPVGEIDTEATAAYIRICEGKVARTEPFGSVTGLVMLDFGTEGNVMGIEIRRRTGDLRGRGLEERPRGTFEDFLFLEARKRLELAGKRRRWR